jgi:multidrug efflux pump subunit AcrB
MKDVQIFSPVASRTVPVRQVVSEFRTSSEDPFIWRRNRVRTVTVHCDPRVGQASVLFERLREQIEDPQNGLQLPPGYQIQWGGEYESSRDAQAGLARSIPGFVVMMILIVICLFNALRQPLIIWLTVPLAMIGVTLGLLMTNQPFGFMALLGALSLSGMLIKNSIVLLDEIGIQRQEKPAYEAIIDSGISRARPVAMAALTTILGMLPLVADAFFIAMAVAIMFGLAFATVLTLVFVPVLYAILFRVPSPP